MMKSAVTKPSLLDQFSGLNRRKDYRDCVKPFNFVLSATVKATDRPPSIKSNAGFHLIAPYSRNPSEWKLLSWTDVHSGESYRIRTRYPSDIAAIRVQTFADILDRFRIHPEAKSAGPDGKPANSSTIGILGRLRVRVFTVSHIGKESNLLEAQQEGVTLADPQAVYSAGNELETVRYWLHRVSIAKVSDLSRVSQRMLRDVRRGTRRPSAKTLEAITAALVRMRDESRG